MQKGNNRNYIVERFENIHDQVQDHFQAFFERKNYPIELNDEIKEMKTRFYEEELTLLGLAREIDLSLNNKLPVLAKEALKTIEEPFMNYIVNQYITSAIEIIYTAKDTFEGVQESVTPKEVSALEKMKQNIIKSRDQGNLPSLN